MIQAVTRAAGLMDAVARSENGLRLSEVAKEAGLNRPTAHNLLRTLRECGYLEQEPAGRYRLGPTLTALANRRRCQGWLRRAEAAVRCLHAAVPDATLTVSELFGQDIWCRMRFPSAKIGGGLQYPEAHTFSAFGSATGLCLQAFNTDYRERMTALHDIGESGERLWPSRKVFDQALRKTILDGFATVRTDQRLRLAISIGDTRTLGLDIVTQYPYDATALVPYSRVSAKKNGKNAPTFAAKQAKRSAFRCQNSVSEFLMSDICPLTSGLQVKPALVALLRESVAMIVKQ